MTIDSATDDVAIEVVDVSKAYSLEPRPWRRLLQQLGLGGADLTVHHALHRINLTVRRGEVIGVLGRNGAGKSTLLQLICGVLQPSSGHCSVRGRVAALLELGAGFSPELSGRENVRLNGPLLGLTAAQIENRLPEIIAFAGIGDFIDQPVRTYSSGMFVRLAFAMSTSIDPDILVIDEALSVGDGAFARKSFRTHHGVEGQRCHDPVLFAFHLPRRVDLLARDLARPGSVAHAGRHRAGGGGVQRFHRRRSAWLRRPGSHRPGRNGTDAGLGRAGSEGPAGVPPRSGPAAGAARAQRRAGRSPIAPAFAG
ncbi:MAG: ABC transporter ATP-binding protein [Rubrivivax sp.]|nr:ABC transporter ATP-binding protein [Rubrivivax sp.]